MKEAIAKYIEAIKADYAIWMAATSEPRTVSEKVSADMVKEFNDTIKIIVGKKYLKVVTGTSVHSFIVVADDGKFKAGDILKAASWAAPAKNQARGNIFGQYTIRWTGTGYLK